MKNKTQGETKDLWLDFIIPRIMLFVLSGTAVALALNMNTVLAFLLP